jgi:hypothetical protein
MLRDARAHLALFACLVCALAHAAPVHAQSATLTGTYIDYVVIGSQGIMLSTTAAVPCPSFGCSMAYNESGSTHTCDAFYPGSPVETFTIAATGAGPVSFHNSFGGFSGTALTTTEGPTLSGRQITWSGEGSNFSGDRVRLETIWEYEDTDRTVHVTMTLTNLGSVALSDVYLMRNADPDFGGCNIGFTSSTDNDVIRQPPTDADALVIAGAGDATSPDRYYVLGIGAHDDRARAYAGGFENSDPVGEWAAPMDPAGVSNDIGVDLIFREETLAAGDSAVFEMFYVWGLTQADVESRFDEVGSGTGPCDGIADGAVCTSRTGVVGTCHAARCCTGCWDGARCRSGTSPSGCGVSGAACVTCADVLFCESNTCMAGVCSGSPCDDGETCTTDSCDEAADHCNHVVTSGCIVGGECVTEGAHHVAYPCLVCDSSRDATDWSAVASGESCGSDRCNLGRLFQGGTCDGAGECIAPHVEICATGECAGTTTCGIPCTATSCPSGERCASSMRCEPIHAAGDACTMDVECGSSMCIDGVCCNGACDGVCESCALPGHMGQCTPIASGTDPYAECNGDRLCDGAGRCVTPGADAGPIDSGAPSDGAVARDAAAIDAATPDASTAEEPRADCACTAAGAGEGRMPLALGLVALGFALTKARRARRVASRRPLA